MIHFTRLQHAVEAGVVAALSITQAPQETRSFVETLRLEKFPKGVH
jgi:hypothetical protein